MALNSWPSLMALSLHPLARNLWGPLLPSCLTCPSMLRWTRLQLSVLPLVFTKFCCLHPLFLHRFVHGCRNLSQNCPGFRYRAKYHSYRTVTFGSYMFALLPREALTPVGSRRPKAMHKGIESTCETILNVTRKQS